MADKNGNDVETKIDDVAKDLKELLTHKDEGAKEETPSAEKATAKKPAAKKSTSKSASANPKSAASKSKTTPKPAAKKTAAKKPQKAAEIKTDDDKTEELSVDEPTADIDEIAKAIAEAEAYEAAVNAAAGAEAPETVPEQSASAEPQAPVSVSEEQPEERNREQEPVQSATEPEAAETAEPVQAEAAATEEKPQKPAKSGSFAAKTDAALKSKKAKLPIFITINSLFLISSILLMFASYAFGVSGVSMTHYNIFQYFANSDIVKAYLVGSAGGWADGAYVMLGILMFLAMLVPLALMIKNIIILVRKKDASVYNADALIYFGTMLLFISMVNLFGAWLSAGQVICLIISAVILAFTLLTMLITKSVKQLPFFSLVNIVLAFVALFLLTWKVYVQGDFAWSPAAAAHATTGGGFMFFMLLVSVFALVALVVLQMKRFRGAIGHIIEIVVPLAAAVCALIAVICAGAAKPDGYSLSGGFVFGMVLTLVIAIADTLFTFLKPLKKFRVMVDDSNDGNGNNVFADGTAEQAETTASISSEPAQTPSNAESAGDSESADVSTAEQTEKAESESVFCSECGAKNAPGSKFCLECGKTLD